MTVLSSILDDLRGRLEEESARMWSDAELTRYINQGCRQVARRAEVIQSFNTTVLAVVGTQKYNLPADVIRVHRVEFVPTGSTQKYPMTASTDDEMDRTWGINQSQQSSNPSFYTIWGTPGLTIADAVLKMKVYPVPAQAGSFNIYYYRVPTLLVNANDEVEVPAGWADLVTLYAEYLALLKDRDERWIDLKNLWEQEIGYLIDVTRQWHDQQRTMQMPTGSQPSWLYEFED